MPNAEENVTPEQVSAGEGAGRDLRLPLGCEGGELTAGACGVFRLEGDLVKPSVDGFASEAVPPIGSRTYGYGLRALAVNGQALVAVERATGGLVRVTRGGVEQLDGSPAMRLGDPHVAKGTAWAVGDRPGGTVASLLAVPLDGGRAHTVMEGAFLSRPAVAPAGDRIAWMAWEPPHMPWQRSTILVADLSGTRLSDVRRVSPDAAAVAQPCFSGDGALWFLCDAAGPMQLWRWDGRTVRRMSAQADDIGLAGTRQNANSYALIRPDRVMAIVWRAGIGHRIEIEPGTGMMREVTAPIALVLDQVVAYGGVACYAASPATGAQPRLLAEGADPARVPAWVWPARAPSGLTIIDLHGGPTALAPPVLPPALAMHHDDGHAVVLLNYRGSSGFGRAWRDALDGHWGDHDVDDVEGTVDTLERMGFARQRMVLRGASAGGFTALNSLARVRGLGGAIVRYGVADLCSLARATHRYERGYLMTLTGARDENDPVLRDRSPITRAVDIDAPLLLLHGDHDEVTPIEQIAALQARLRWLGRRCELHVMRGEGHGFHTQAALARCLALERAFLADLAC